MKRRSRKSHAALVQSPAWLCAFLAGLAVCLALTMVVAWRSEFQPGNAWGLAFGVTGTVLMVGAGAYSMRRRAPRRGPGAARNWLQFHLYGGSLFLALILMHSGFRLPQGILSWSLWILSLWMVVSGILGSWIQKWIPRLLTSGLSTEVHYDRIPGLVEDLRIRAESLADEADESTRQFYRTSLAQAMALPRTRLIYFIDITGGILPTLRQFEHVGRFLDETERAKLEELRNLFQTKAELDAHHTLQKALRWWLYGHVPFSLLLFVLVGFHIFSIAYY